MTIIERLPPPIDAGIFGLDTTLKDSELVLLPCAWDATVSYGEGAAKGPSAIYSASHQLDLFDLDYKDLYTKGIYFDKPMMSSTFELNQKSKKAVVEARNSKYQQKFIDQTNLNSQIFNDLVYKKSIELLSKGKKVGLIGGDHSSPFGYLTAINEFVKEDFTILHFDAHLDCRQAYEGFEHSHASIMFNASKLTHTQNIIHIGVRDFCREEIDFAKKEKNPCFYGSELFADKASGKTWHKITENILSNIKTKNVYISFDIDGLDPSYCPGTGTPVPEGLSYSEAIYILRSLYKREHQIVGFDLCEVAPWPMNEWNENVGARVLYQLCLGTLNQI